MTDEYVKYRGGRQSLYRLNNNIEFVIMVDTTRKSVRNDIRRIDESILYRKLLLQARKCYSRNRLEEYFLTDPESSSIGIREEGIPVTIETKDLYRIDERSLESVARMLGSVKKKRLLNLLLLCECKDISEEIDETIRVLEEGGDGSFVSHLPTAIKKICHRKYREIYYSYLEKIKLFGKRYPSLFSKIEGRIADIEELGKRRFSA